MPKIAKIVKDMKKNLYIESGFNYNQQEFNDLEASLKTEIKKFLANMIKTDMETRDSLKQRSSVMGVIEKEPSLL